MTSSPNDEVRARRKHPDAECENCDLASVGTFVPSKFPAGGKAQYAVVGEAPGFHETFAGEPFIGESGQLLNKVFQHHGIARKNLLLTNVCLCRPDSNNSTPSPQAQRSCKPRLLKELEQAEPERVLALGAPAAQTLLNNRTPITQQRVGNARPSPDGFTVVPSVHPAYCVAPHTKILTADLRWIRAEDLSVDDKLIGFDEEYTKGNRRCWRESEVTSTGRAILPSYRITTTQGTVTSSADHLWLVRPGYGRQMWKTTEWVAQRQAQGGVTELFHWMEPWEEQTSYEAGYLAGFFDGEAYLHKQDGIGWGQNDGETSNRVVELCKDFGFEVRTSLEEGKKCRHFNLGGRKQGLRAAGMFRPVRLLPKTRQVWEGVKCYAGPVQVLKVEYLGEKEVVTLNTSTRTFIANGFMSHNCLRNGDAFPYLIRDVEKLYRDMPPWTPPEYVVADDEELALTWIYELAKPSPIGKYIDGKRVLVFDIECGIDKDNDYDHPDRYEMLCIGICYAKGRVVVFGERVMQNKKVINALTDLLKHCLLAGHNGKFDCAGVYPFMGDIRLWFDTMLAHYCIDERPGNHKLGQLGPELLGTPDWKGAIDKYLGTGKNYAAIPRPELYRYNAYDDAVTWDLMEYFLGELERRGLRSLHDFLVDASNQLKFPELNGITIDRARNIQLTDYYMGIIGDLREQIDKIVQDPEDGLSRKDYDKFGGLNPNSPKQIKEYLHDHGHRVAETKADVLERLLERIDASSNVGRFLSLLLESRYNVKRHGTYVKGIRSRMYRGRVYTSYLLHGTTSGRLASRNPNLQNIVRDKAIKSQFTVSKVGNIFVAADYKQAEGRIICTLAQDEYLAGIFRDPDRDLFDELGLGLYPSTFDHNDKDQRVRIKAYFYGLGYGREAFSIAQEYRLPVREVEDGLKKFFSLIPDVVRWQESIKQQILQGHDLVTEFGRHRRFYLITDRNKKDVLNEGLSFKPQSIASDICLRAFIRLRPRLRGKAFFRLTIHDALVAECKEEDKEYVAQVMREEMLRSAKEWTTYVPFEVDISYGKNWGELS